MKSYEMVETLSEKTNVSLAQAKEALERSNWDMLDAAIYIEKKKSEQVRPPVNDYESSFQKEKEGRFSTPNYTQFSGAPNNQQFNQKGNFNNVPPFNPNYNQPPVSVGELLGRLCGNIENAVNKCFYDVFVVRRHGKKIFQIPLLIFLISLCAPYIVLPLLFIGLFFNLHYSFEGKSKGKETLNDFFDNAKNAADKVKEDFKTEYDELKEDFQKGRGETKD